MQIGTRSKVIGGVSILAAGVVIASTLLTYWFGNRVLRAHAHQELPREVIKQLNELASTVKAGASRSSRRRVTRTRLKLFAWISSG